jgi:hypothetical protein
MLDQFIVGGIASICNIMIHAMVMAAVVRTARLVGARHPSHPTLLLISVMVAVVSVLMVAHTFEVLVWSLTYLIVDAIPSGFSHVYFAFVNYTTLGYGDIIPVHDWQLLGPMTAMNGVILFGWSTAVLFEVLRKVMVYRSDTGASK